MMKHMTIRRMLLLLAGFLAITLCGTICACRTGGSNDTTGTGSTTAPPITDTDVTGVPGTEPATADDTESSVAESDTETTSEAETFPPYVGANGKTIQTAAGLANMVTGHYTSALRDGFVIENRNVHLTYNLGDAAHPFAIRSLTTPAGAVYLSDTMDSFIQMKNGKTYYASGASGRVNVYDQGFYYYDVHVLDQSFDGAGAITAQQSINIRNILTTNDMERVLRNKDGSITLTIKSIFDPYIAYMGFRYDTTEYTAVQITMRSYAAATADLFYVAGSHAEFNGDQRRSFAVINDGEFHTYLVMLANGNDYTDTLRGLRLDIGSTPGEKIDIQEIKLVRFEEGIPQVTLDRDFISYSDKINDVVRFMANESITGVAAMGTEIRLPADTVAGLVVGDAQGVHTELSGVDWNTAVYVGFDIKDAGVLGVILLPHETSGRLSVELTDGTYIVRQSYTPAGGELKKSSSHYIGHRIYTDTNHRFDEFLYAAYCERNPLTGVRVLSDKKDAWYVGYNALRGAYEFAVRNGGSFAPLYENPGEIFGVTFEIDGDDRDRQIYVLASTTNGCIECAAVLDKDDRMLPIPLEVCKNFAHDGEELYYTDNDSQSYGLVFLPMVVEAGNTEQLTVLHLFEKWGQFRLKQVSSIRFHQAYYHMSTGVTETNCICFYNYLGNRLPDHRGMSQLYWRDVYFGSLDKDGNLIGSGTMYSNQPQHEANGVHSFLQYRGEDGKTVGTESIRHRIDSSGPTYFDLTMHYLSGDGKMQADIRHMEMAQYDENRAYYQLDYRVLHEMSIADFRNNFELYAMTTNRSQQYRNLGYLDADNKSQVVPANTKGDPVVYRLGDQCPYFDYFTLEDTDPTVFDQSDVYSNISALIKDWDIVIGGQKYTGPLLLVEHDGRCVLTLDLDSVTLQPGDYIRVNLILMPWGDNQSADDSNVRLTRENTLLNPIVATSEKDTVSNDPFLPIIRSADGLSAEFTVSGGLDNIDRVGYASEGNTGYKTHYDRDYNVAIRVEGFRDLGRVCLYELIGTEWKLVELASDWGYDGYSVLYDADNSFSYSFNINMNEAKPRTFRVVVG